MFTGLVEDIGTLSEVNRQGDGVVFAIAPADIPVAELAVGESVAVDGVCLTVTSVAAQRFRVLAGAETLRRTTLGTLRAGARVNLERALQVGDRLGGHLVSGHVDTVGQLSQRRDLGSNLELTIRVAAEHMRYVVTKGSICIDGISLTVNTTSGSGFSVALIPHTCDATTLAGKRVGDSLNLELDIIGKYVEKLVDGYRR